MDKDIYDVIIIGGGPAGLTAGLYACRARLNTLLVEKACFGGQAAIADKIENFPGFPDGITGPSLADWMHTQARHFGLNSLDREAVNVTRKTDSAGGVFEVGFSDQSRIRALSVIIATGARWNALGIPGEKELTGRGVSYCATCDGPLFRDKTVVVVGGGDTALEDAIFLTKFASKVIIVHRRDRLRATKILQERARSNGKIELCLNSKAIGIKGSAKVEAVTVSDVISDKTKDIRCDGVFILIGMTPNSGPVKGLAKLTENGYIICDDDMRTSVGGLFACGDVRKKILRQVVTACGDGATAAFSAEHYVDDLKGTGYG